MKKKILVLGLLILPVLIFAEDTGNLSGTLTTISSLLDSVKTIIFALAFLAFFYGLAKFIFSASGEDKENGKSIMIWGIIALFIMFSIWGIIKILQGSFVTSNDAQNIPAFPQIGKELSA